MGREQVPQKFTRSRKIQSKIEPVTIPEIVCLGFGVGTCDRIRLNHFQKFMRTKVIGVNECFANYEEKCEYEHREGIFSSTSGLASVLTSNTILVILDYFWLQRCYYSKRYGMMWVVPDGQIEYMLTKTNVETVILPLDTSHELITSIKRNLTHLKRFCKIEYLTHLEAMQKHPLVLSDLIIDAMIPKDRGSCTDQLERYTPGEKAFAVFQKLTKTRVLSRTRITIKELLN
jgi:hypothetical protein